MSIIDLSEVKELIFEALKSGFIIALVVNIGSVLVNTFLGCVFGGRGGKNTLW